MSKTQIRIAKTKKFFIHNCIDSDESSLTDGNSIENVSKDALLFKEKFCPNNHNLIMRCVSNDNILCDVCDRPIICGNFICACPSCDFDVCNHPKCHEKISEYE